jgi:hypothetical protein
MKQKTPKQNAKLKVVDQNQQNKENVKKRKKLNVFEISSESEESETESKSNKRKKVSSNLPEFTTNLSKQPVYYMPIVQQPPNKAKSKTKAQESTNNRKKNEIERKIEVIAIKYICPSDMHPNHALHNHIDRYPIEQIIGYGTQIQKADVSQI